MTERDDGRGHEKRGAALGKDVCHDDPLLGGRCEHTRRDGAFKPDAAARPSSRPPTTFEIPQQPRDLAVKRYHPMILTHSEVFGVTYFLGVCYFLAT